MNTINKMVICALLVLSSAAFAQKESVSAFYRYNMNIVNPAYAGVDNETIVSGTLRSQWSGIEDAPETQTVFFSTPLGHNLGIGLDVLNDKTFIEKQTYLALDLSYKLDLGTNQSIYLGIKAGGNFYNVNTAGLQNYGVESDQALASISNFNPNIGVGAVYKNESMYVSLSVPMFLKTNRAANKSDYAMVVSQSPQFYLSGGYDIKLNSYSTELILKPSVMMRYSKDSSVIADFTTMLEIENNFNIGVMYRTSNSYGSLASILLGKHFLLGYSFEISTMPQLASAKNTNEILLQYKF